MLDLSRTACDVSLRAKTDLSIGKESTYIAFMQPYVFTHCAVKHLAFMERTMFKYIYMYIMLCYELLCLESVDLMPACMRAAIANKVG